MRMNSDLLWTQDRSQASKFVEVARNLMLSRGRGAAGVADIRGADVDVIEVLTKNAVGGHVTADNGLAVYNDMVAGFQAIVAHYGLFDGCLPDFRSAPLHTALRIITGHGTAHAVNEATAKPVTRLEAARQTLQERKITALIVLTEELLRFAGSSGQDLLQAAMLTSIAVATDAVFVPVLIAAAAGGVSLGPDSRDVLDDLRRALVRISTGIDSRLHVGVGVDVAKRLSVMPNAVGSRAFPEMSPGGGMLGGMPAHVTEALTDSVLVVDAAAYAGSSLGIELRTGRQAAIEVADDPTNNSGTPVETTLVSMFQTNSVALLAERAFAFEPIRTPNVAKITGVQWGLDPNASPPA